MADAAPADAWWCGASQVADALVAMRRLVTEGIVAGADAREAGVLT